MSLVTSSNKLQSGYSSNRKAIEQWWFSKHEMSLYLARAEREKVEGQMGGENIQKAKSDVYYLKASSVLAFI
jgi:virulence-associated protein VapD